MSVNLIPIHRVSTAEQAGDNGEGLDRQRHATRQLAAFHKADLLDPVEIIDVSGSDVDKTPEWAAVVERIRTPNVHIAVDSIDRLLRADSFNFRVFQDIKATNTLIYSPGKVHDLTKPDDGFMAGLLALVGGREKEEIKRRIAAGREAARRRGWWPLKDAALPRGCTFDRTTKKWGYTADADIIRHVFHEFVQEGRALRAIAREVGKPMQTIRGYLLNPIYKGWLVFDKRRGDKPYASKRTGHPDRPKVMRAESEIIRVQVYGLEGQEPPLVTEAQWAAAQQRLKRNSQRFVRLREEGRPDAWASGYMVSGAFDMDIKPGQRFTFDPAEQPKFEDSHTIYANGGIPGSRRYSCRCCRQKSQRSPGDERPTPSRCGFGNPSGPKVNKTLDAFLVDLTADDTFVEAVLQEMTSRSKSTGKKELLERRLADLHARENRLEDLYLDGRIGKAKHAARQDELRVELATVRDSLSAIASEELTEADLREQARKWTWDPQWDHQKKRDWLSKYVRAIRVSNEGVEGATVRVHTGSGSMPVFFVGRPMSWVEPIYSRARPNRAHLRTASFTRKVQSPTPEPGE